MTNKKIKFLSGYRIVFCYLFLLVAGNVHGQTQSLFSTDFETTSNFFVEHNGINKWKVSTCAGNGISQNGVMSLYVSKEGTIPNDCGQNGQDQYAFASAPPSGIERMIAYVKINGLCTKSHVVSFDYKLFPQHISHVAEVVYSIDQGNFWFVQDTIPYHDNWIRDSFLLDEVTNLHSDFWVGLRFIYSDMNTDGFPLAIDNFTVVATPAIANIDMDTLNLCGVNSTIIEADHHYTGNGTWTIISGQGIISNAVAASTAINNLGFGQHVFEWMVTSTECGTSRDTIVVNNYIAPSTAHLTDTIFACATQSLPISTAPPISGMGTWHSPQGGTISEVNNPITILSNIPKGWSQLVWSVETPGCPPNTDTCYVFALGGQQIITPDTTLCSQHVGTDAPMLIVTTTLTDEYQTEQWYFMNGGAYYFTPEKNQIALSQLYPGENKLVYKVRNSACPYTDVEYDTITIYVAECTAHQPQFPTVITPNGDGKNDVFVINNLQNNHPNCHIRIFNRWGDIVFESVGYDKPWNGTRNGEQLPIGTYFFTLDLNDDKQTRYTGAISLIY